MWLVYAVLRAAIAINQKRLARQQEAQDRLWRVLHPLLAPGGGAGGCVPHGGVGSTLRQCFLAKCCCCLALPSTACSLRGCLHLLNCSPFVLLLHACGCRQSFRAFKAIRPRLTLQFEGLGLELPDGRSILNDVTGRWELAWGEQAGRAQQREWGLDVSEQIRDQVSCHAADMRFPTVWCRFEHSRVAAVMGPSGAGKLCCSMLLCFS